MSKNTDNKSRFKSFKENLQYRKTNIFTKYFLLFAIIFLVVFMILGSSLFLLVNNYSTEEKTRLITGNITSISNTIQKAITPEEMNKRYSIEKAMLCSSLATVSKSINADIFVCDVEGNIIMCKDKTVTNGFGKFVVCPSHEKMRMESKLLSAVYQQEVIVQKSNLFGKKCFVVGCPIYSNGNIIGSVFAISEMGFQSLTIEFIRIFVVTAFFCLIFAFLCIYYLTKKMITPLQKMSKAAKEFANGDFSYRLKIEGNDELADLGIAFNDMADALDALESSRRSFVSNVSHELKTPMTSIAGFIDGILDGTIPLEKEKYYLGLVSGEVRRLSRLVVSMLNMSKIESGDLEMKPNRYDITDQIIQILLTFEQKINNKNIDIRGLDKMSQTFIEADPDMIYQAIYNLFDNAVKFTNEDGFIEINLIDKDSFVEINITNSGEGIKADELSKIFERFYKVDKSRSLDSKGAGLGLYIVKLMIEMHGGSIVAHSDSETTATFTFNLPKKFSPIYKKEKK